MGRRYTQHEFIEKCKMIHGGKYDYSEVVYINGNTKICIMCPVHGEFWQLARMHLSGQGCPECAKTMRKQTCKERYGEELPFCSVESRRKTKETVRAKYGVDNVFQLESVKEKIRQTNLDRYGVDNPMKCEEIQQKAIRTNIERYGVPCTMQNEMVQAHHRESMLAKYHVEFLLQSPQYRKQVEQTCLKKYGVRNVRQSPIVDGKIRLTNMEKYGVPYAIASSVVRKKIMKSLLLRYGVDNPMKCEEIRHKVVQTNLERYGVRNIFELDIVRELRECANMSKYGVPYVLQSDIGKKHMIDVKKERGTLNTSRMEETCYDTLVNFFGAKEIKRQYKSKQYPYFCDFYIVSLDMYVELNLFWTHGEHWFDENNIDDKMVVQRWMSYNSEFYKNAVFNWTIKDVEKRSVACKEKLRYAVFWNSNIHEFFSWTLNGCPVRYDWK